MKVVNVVVEGHTEQVFVETVLQPYTMQRNVHMISMIVKTGKKNQPGALGGTVRFEMLKSQLEDLLQVPATLTTTMFDFVGLHQSFFDLVEPSINPGTAAVEDIEAAMLHALHNPPNFIPFIMKHEFEALLFSSDEHLPDAMSANARERSQFLNVLREFHDPEEINRQHHLSPSNRILRIWPDYGKISSGVTVLEKVGVDTLRKRCPHFNRWIEQLLTSSTAPLEHHST